MPVQFVRGDLFAQRGLDGLAHACNCAGAMGKGVAVQFKSRFPKMYKEYKARCSDGRFGLGDVFAWSADGVTVYNLGNQKTWRGKADFDATVTSLQAMVEHADAHGVRRIGMPQIGAGLGGLSWSDIKRTLEQLGAKSQVDLIVFERFAAGVEPLQLV